MFTEKQTEDALILCMLGNFSGFCCLLTKILQNKLFKIFFQKHYQVKQFDPGQDHRSISPDLGPNCLQTEGNQQTTKVAASKERVINILCKK